MSKSSHAVNIGTNRQILFDDGLTQSKQGFKLTGNPPIRHDQPVVVQTESWEKLGLWR
jgi:hypothetical protein